ncbi:MAG: 30S ribosomal protein S8e [archaeon]|nr:30S ribosomal protein S8e [archaeon]
MPIHRKKRKFEMGRQPSNTKLGERKVIPVRGRGCVIKQRALKLNEGTFTWVSERISRKCKILEVVYNATNNELVRTQTLVKNTIVSVDPSPFKFYWYIHYEDNKVTKLPEIKDEKRKQALEDKRNKLKKPHPNKENLDKLGRFFELMNKGRLYACISSRPGQSGRADGYLLEGKELEFYLKKLEKK